MLSIPDFKWTKENIILMEINKGVLTRLMLKETMPALFTLLRSLNSTRGMEKIDF